MRLTVQGREALRGSTLVRSRRIQAARDPRGGR